MTLSDLEQRIDRQPTGAISTVAELVNSASKGAVRLLLTKKQ